MPGDSMTDEEYAAYLEDRRLHPRRGRIRQQHTKYRRATYEKNGTRPSRRRPPRKAQGPIFRNTTFYFIDDVPHKIIYVNKARDYLRAKRLTDNKEVEYLYTEARRKMRRAYSTTEAGRLLGRTGGSLKVIISKKKIRRPFFVPSPTKQAPWLGRYLWSEKDIMDAHEFYVTQGRNINGDWQRTDVPPKREIRALMDGEKTMYIQTESGDYVPLWREPRF